MVPLCLEDRSLLFSGDALVTLDMTRGRTGPRVIRGPVTEDADRALESLDVRAATNAQTVLTGHGEPWLDGVTRAVAIARQTGWYRDRASEVESCVAAAVRHGRHHNERR